MRRARMLPPLPALLALLVAVALAACGQLAPRGGEEADGEADGGDLIDGELVAAGVDREAPQDAPVEEAVAGLAVFGHELYLAAGADPATNTVLSPASIGMAFAMARAGAAGDTAAEIDEVLRLPDGAHGAFNALERAVVTVDGPPSRPDPDATPDPVDPSPPVVAIANGLFAQEGLTVRQEFLETLATHYGAGVRVVDFGAPEAAKETIDAWVREQTAERIEELFDELPPDTKLVLANAIYLKADWRHPFAEQPVRPAPFTLADDSEVEAPTMSRTGEMRHAEASSWQAVELPYAGDELAMWVLVPRGSATPADLLDPEVLAAVDAGLAEGVVDLALPQWDFAYDLDLVEPLRSLGLELPFSGAADFSGITPDAGLFIEQAVHRANITVDEWGIEAAAVTGLGFPTTSGPPTPDAVIRADRPFAFVIRHLPTSAPLFLGHVADPTDVR